MLVPTPHRYVCTPTEAYLVEHDALVPLAHAPFQQLEGHLCSRHELSGSNQTGDGSDLGSRKALGHGRHEAAVSAGVVVDVGDHDGRRGPPAGIAGVVEAWYVLAHIPHTMPGRDGTGRHVRGGVVDDDDLCRGRIQVPQGPETVIEVVSVVAECRRPRRRRRGQPPRPAARRAAPGSATPPRTGARWQPAPPRVSQRPRHRGVPRRALGHRA